MVEVIDEYKEKLEAEKYYEHMYQSAERFFPGRVRKNTLDRQIGEIVVETVNKQLSVEIYPNSNMIYVHHVLDFWNALELATQEEKTTSKRFFLKTTYPIGL